MDIGKSTKKQIMESFSLITKVAGRSLRWSIKNSVGDSITRSVRRLVEVAIKDSIWVSLNTIVWT